MLLIHQTKLLYSCIHGYMPSLSFILAFLDWGMGPFSVSTDEISILFSPVIFDRSFLTFGFQVSSWSWLGNRGPITENPVLGSGASPARTKSFVVTFLLGSRAQGFGFCFRGAPRVAGSRSRDVAVFSSRKLIRHEPSRATFLARFSLLKLVEFRWGILRSMAATGCISGSTICLQSSSLLFRFLFFPPSF